MIAARSARCAAALASRSARSTLPSSSQATTTTRMPAICADAGLVPCADAGIRQTSRCAFAARGVVRPDDQQSRVLALRAGVGLQRDRRVAGDRAQHALEPGDHLAIADRLVGRRERMHVRELAPGHRDHFDRRIELHRARAQRNHRAVERDVLVGQAAQIAQHRRLGVIAVERRMGEKRRRAAQAPAATRRRPSASMRVEIGQRGALGARRSSTEAAPGRASSFRPATCRCAPCRSGAD